MKQQALILITLLLIACESNGPSANATTTRPQTPLPTALATAEALADEWMADNPRMAWSWVEMVAAYGLWHLYEVSGDPAILAYIDNYVSLQHRGYQPVASDWLSPAVLDLLVCTETQQAANCERLVTYDDYFVTCKREQGALVHWTGIADWDRQIWVDTIFMAGAYMLERARHLPDNDAAPWWNDLIQQFTVFDRYLKDSDTGLMNHAYDFASTTPIMNGTGAFWGRGNGWYVAMLGLTLKRLPADHAARAELTALWHHRVDALLPLQDDAGFWHTMLTAPTDTYPEASATALFAFGMAAGLNAGLVHDGAAAAVERAVAALDASISVVAGRHVLPQISEATVPGTVTDYLAISIDDNIAYGVGAYLLAAVEMARLRGEIAEPLQ